METILPKMPTMNANPFLSILAHIVLLPPLNLLLLIGAGALLRRRWARLGRAMCAGGMALLLVLCCEAGARLLTAPLEAMTAPLSVGGASGAQAIVVLAAGSLEDAPDYHGEDIPDRITLARLRYGARLQHDSGLPLLLSGGNASADGQIEAKAISMARALREDFRTPVAWLEERSSNTAENAAFSAAILRGQKIQRILLVTDAIHMPRARRAFVRQGLEVVDAPTMFIAAGPLRLSDFLPTANALQRSYYASYEWLGLAWSHLSE
jgi:uncharacterized SAM-binding protein YcdF (DUF218 family)